MARIQKWGNSLAVRIPKTLAEELQVKEDTPVEVRVRAGALLVVPRKRPRYSLTDLLKGCRKRNLHGETDWGRDIGREVLE